MHDEHHRSHRTGWLRAAVLGANDGLLSTASLLIGVSAGNVSRGTIVLTGVAAMAGGALAMASGEYSSVSSQRDAEHADVAKEIVALRDRPEAELAELAGIYRQRGLSADLAREVASKLHEHDSLGAHLHDELRLDPDALAQPVQAALTSAVSFAAGALVPVVAMGLLGRNVRAAVTVVLTLVALALLGGLAARMGGASPRRAITRLVVLGAVSMVITSVIGNLVGAAV